MITCIEIDGFKTFQNFRLELAPLQIIVGANGVGKSNLFDALRLLARLTNSDLRTAFQDMRGEAGELFTTLPDGQSVNRIRLAVELFVEGEVKDDWGALEVLTYRRLRYELEILRQADKRGLERLYVDYEALTPIQGKNDTWLNQHNLLINNWLPRVTGEQKAFISTDKAENRVSLHQDGRSGRKVSVTEKIERTVLSGVINTQFPHAFAVREEIQTWHFWQLNPDHLRQPSPLLAPQFITPNGENLPATLARLKAEDPFILNDISRDLANLIPDILNVDVYEDAVHKHYLIQAHTQDGRTFSSRVLSDGTLRALALVTLKNDPQHHGLLCFEEPENGVHPFRLENIVHVLQELATDFNDSTQINEPLRQLLVNTHSPVLIKQPEMWSKVLFAQLVNRVEPNNKNSLMSVTRIQPTIRHGSQLPFNHLGISDEESSYTINQIIDYLNTANTGQVINEIKGQIHS